MEGLTILRQNDTNNVTDDVTWIANDNLNVFNVVREVHWFDDTVTHLNILNNDDYFYSP